MRLILSAILLLLMLPSLCFAGPVARRAMGVSKVILDPPTAMVINGISGISSGGITDTGTATIATGRGYIRTDADCTGSAAGGTYVYLVVDGSARDELFCDEILTPNARTLIYYVEPGDHSVRIYGTTVSDVYNAGNFLKPTP